MSDLQAKARAWGICGDSIVVVYDNSGGAQASRAWWTLRWAGLANVRVLDGGYGAWIATGRPSSNHVATHAALAGNVVLTSGGMPTIDAEEAAALAAQSGLSDARPRAAYAAILPNRAPAYSRRHSRGRRRQHRRRKIQVERRITRPFSSLGADGSTKIAVYCGSGNAAAHAIAAMSAVGLKAALYVGSWSAWSADPSRPVATGPEPG